MPGLARNVTIDKTDGKVSIDGAEFPWYIAEDGISIDGLGRESFTTVNISVMTKTVTVIPLKGDEDA